MPDEAQHYGSTVAPLVVKDMVIAGVSGADWGIRGFLSAYKADTGERAWRFWTIPAKGDPGYDTWQGMDPEIRRRLDVGDGQLRSGNRHSVLDYRHSLSRFPTIVTAAATTCSPIASWR